MACPGANSAAITVSVKVGATPQRPNGFKKWLEVMENLKENNQSRNNARYEQLLRHKNKLLQVLDLIDYLNPLPESCALM
jgi:hypothetical protein